MLPTEQAVEVIAAAENVRQKDVAVELHGWKLQWTRRHADRHANRPRGDFLFIGPSGRPVNTIRALRQAVGLHEAGTADASQNEPPEEPAPRRSQRPSAATHQKLAEGNLLAMSSHRLLGQRAVGRRCAVLWAGCSPPTWFSGTIRDFSSPLHLIAYDDGDVKWHHLEAEIAAGHLCPCSDSNPRLEAHSVLRFLPSAHVAPGHQARRLDPLPTSPSVPHWGELRPFVFTGSGKQRGRPKAWLGAVRRIVGAQMVGKRSLHPLQPCLLHRRRQGEQRGRR